MCDIQGRCAILNTAALFVLLSLQPQLLFKEYRGVEWSEGGDVGTPISILVSLTAYHPQTRGPWINVVKQERSPASAVMGCRTAIRLKLYWAKWGSETRGPPAEKLSQQKCSFQFSLAKPLKKFTHRHSPYSANIGYSMHVVVCLNCACAHVWLHILLQSRKSWSADRKRGESRGKRGRKLPYWCFSDAGPLKTHHEICFFTGSDRPSTMNWSPDGDLALCVVIFSSAHLPAQILDNLLAPGIPNPTIHPHSLRPCVSQHGTGVYFGSL